MKSTTLSVTRSTSIITVCTLVFSCLLLCDVARTKAQTTSVSRGTGFAPAQEAGDALLAAAEKYDEKGLEAILGPNSYDIVHSGEPVRDREMAIEFASQARTKQSITRDPNHAGRMILNVGNDEWPFPVPLVKFSNKWYFDSKDGRTEILFRRIGRNELDAIEICRGYVEAQHEYAMLKKDAGVNQYAQRIISTPGKQDGLAWQNADGAWEGPVGENVAKAIARGYTSR